MSGLWMFLCHIPFNYLNEKDGYRLLTFWKRLTLELPIKSDKDNIVADWSRKENEQFWSKVDHINSVWYKTVSIYSVLLSAVFSSQLFFVRLSIELTV